MMELKQMAESIMLISSKKRLQGDTMRMRFKNRPVLWRERAEKAREESGLNSKKGRVSAAEKIIKGSLALNDWKIETKQLYCVQFDSSINLKKTWVDGKIINLFNAQRDNIFASSSKYDIVQFKRQGTAAQYHRSTGRHSDSGTVSSNTNQGKNSPVTRRAGPSTPAPKHHPAPGKSLSLQQQLALASPQVGRQLGAEAADMSAKGYGFCHHCKQVKSKYLLARCNYNSQKMGHTVPAVYTVRDVRIYNSKLASPSPPLTS